MPNYVRNQLFFDPGCAPIIAKECLIDGKEFSFNSIIPCPKDLEIEYGSRSEDGLRLYLSKISPDCADYFSPSDKVDEVYYNKVMRLVEPQLLFHKASDILLKKEDFEKLKDKY